jgi:hypothetical protein
VAINQTPGEIYFIREQDLLTHEFSTYVKVGLVRDNEERDSEQRLLEHQTGNPRKLSIHKIVRTDAVSAIEGVLHGLYAPYRVSGEWFDFDQAKLDSCIAKAEELAAEAKANIAIIEKAAQLKDVVSDGEPIKPTPEILDFHAEYLAAKFCLDECARRDDEIKALFIEAEEAEEEVGHLIEKQERKGRAKLDTAALFEAHPEIKSKYIKVDRKITGRLTWVTTDVLEISMNILGDGVDEFMMELDKGIEAVHEKRASFESLQELSLQLTEYETAAEWHLEIATANLKAACGTAPGIEGILKWPRTETVKESFDEKAFKEAEPDLYEKFTTVGETVVAHKVKKTKAAPEKI